MYNSLVECLRIRKLVCLVNKLIDFFYMCFFYLLCGGWGGVWGRGSGECVQDSSLIYNRIIVLAINDEIALLII